MMKYMENREMADFIEMGKRIVALQQQAYYAYAPLVADLCCKVDTTENEVGLMLDCLLMYCDNKKVLDLYKQVCRSFYKKYPKCISQYINWYREEYGIGDRLPLHDLSLE